MVPCLNIERVMGSGTHFCALMAAPATALDRRSKQGLVAHPCVSPTGALREHGRRSGMDSRDA